MKDVSSDDLAARMLMATLIGLPSLYGAVFLQESYLLLAHHRLLNNGPAMLDLHYAAFEANRALRFPVALLAVPLAGVVLTLRISRWMKILFVAIVLITMAFLHYGPVTIQLLKPRNILGWTLPIPTASIAILGAVLGSRLGTLVARRFGDA